MHNWFVCLMLILAGPAIGYLGFAKSGDYTDGIAVWLGLWFCAYLVFTNSNPSDDESE